MKKNKIISDIVEDIPTNFEKNIEAWLTPPSMEALLLSPINNTLQPLSRGQRALWFIHQLHPESVAYSIAKAVRIEEEINLQALERAFGMLSERHAVLRATFIMRDGEPLQRVNKDTKILFNIEDASSWSEAFLDDRIAEEAYSPFDLEKGPLFRVNLFMRSPKEYIILVSVHQIIVDYQSFVVLMNELGMLYVALASGTNSTLPPIEFQFADYVRWHEELIKGSEGERQLKYWRKKLSGEIPVLNLPTDRPRPPVQTYNGAVVSFKIHIDLTNRLKTIADKECATLFMVLLSAFQILLYRYTGQNDIIVGSPVNGRSNAKLEKLVGCFLNFISIRTRFSENLTFKEFLAQVNKTVIEALQNQDYPFASLVEKLRLERDTSRSPIFQVAFMHQNTHFTGVVTNEQSNVRIKMGRLDVEPMALQQKTSQLDLSMNLTEREGLFGSIEYNTDLFDKPTIECMAEHFQSLLENIVEQPDQKISKLQFLTEKEKQLLLVRWNDTKADFSSDVCVHNLFEEQVKLTPDSVAAVFGDVELTYSELNNRANKLAHYLKRLGIGPDVLVGICVERSLNMLVGLLGILKAGGTYVPLDPAYPRDRLDFMLQDSQLQVLLTQEKLLDILPVNKAHIVYIDDGWEDAIEESDDNSQSSVTPQNLAYVIYTSGSTGKPKGVQIPHLAVVNFLNSMRKVLGIIKNDILLSLTTLSFDIAMLEIFLPITVGARVVFISREVASDGSKIAEKISECGATIMQATPATWRLLIEAGWQGKGDLKILCGGEMMPRELGNQLLKRGSSLWNMYGSTETTVWSSVCKIESGDGVISVGRPIDNTRIYILDSNLEPVPVGLTGEVYIGGHGLACGYLNRPELTAETFIKDPFVSGQLMYRTGDLARYLADGNIEILGRVDFQVKIRGFRIELGEIEAALSKHSAIKEVAVMAHEVRSGEQYLIAYYICDPNAIPSNNELRNLLSSELPDYMIPSAFIRMEVFPLTPNGKVDRNALPLPGGLPGINYKSGNVYVAPRSETERIIAEIWQEMLQQENISIQDSFFDIGGHSLLLAKVQNRLKKALNKDVSILDMVKFSTIRALAKFISKDDVDDVISPDKKSKRKRIVGDERINANTDIAIIGMAGRFPGAKNIDEFWQNIRNGKECISFFNDDELIESGVDLKLLTDCNYVRARGILEDAEAFDASFFGYSPREAELLDPQHRVFLECAWEVLENSGYGTQKFDGKIGVFAGVGLNYYLLNMYRDIENIDSEESWQAFIGNDKDFIPTKVSYKLNLKGPSISVQTGCSSSLTAIHLACQSIYNRECDIALAGGVSIMTPQKQGYKYWYGGVTSPDGHCRAFDKNAKGTVYGNGVGIVALKRLSDAIADRNYIYAVIKGTAINNDGCSKTSYIAPSIEGQTEVLRKALEVSHVEPDSITYIEAHGAGTNMSDIVEIAALKEAYHGVSEREYCAIGSVKNNIGHLNATSGVASLIKTALALKNKVIPPNVNIDEPNPQLEIEGSPFYINKRLTEWKANDLPRRAGVSSFGIGGTNVHVIMEEAPQIEDLLLIQEPNIPQVSSGTRPWKLLVLSANTPTALESATQNLIKYLKDNPEVNLTDVAYTLQVGRREMAYRRAVVCNTSQDAIASLQSLNPTLTTAHSKAEEHCVTFMFPGPQGVQTQYMNMMLELYRTEPIFMENVDKCLKLLKPQTGNELKDLLYLVEKNIAQIGERLQNILVVQMALFVIEYSLAKMLMEWGINPKAMIGYSISEYVAACIAGVMSLEDALSIVAIRGRLMQNLPGGAMMVVYISEDRACAHLQKGVEISSVIGPNLCIVSGTYEAIKNLEKTLKREGISTRRLPNSHAFHSHMMEPIVRPLIDRIRRIKLSEPKIPFISNVTGTWITPEEATSPDYWARHICQTIRFLDGMKELLRQPDRVFVEVGSGQMLCTMVKQIDDSLKVVAVQSSTSPYNIQGIPFLSVTLGKLWLAGVQINWEKFYAGEKRCRLPLPTYPFERKRYMIHNGKKAEKSAEASGDTTGWFYCI